MGQRDWQVVATGRSSLTLEAFQAIGGLLGQSDGSSR
jgi:hypothetical protein